MSAVFGQLLSSIVASDDVQQNAPLAPLTTFKVGGPAEWLVKVRTEEQLRGVLSAARDANMPVRVLGGGSNILVSDAGVRGVVIRTALTDVSEPRQGIARAGAGVTMNGLVRWTIGRGMSSLEAWAGTPGTVGGAIYGNAHYGGRNIGDLVSTVQLAMPNGELRDVPATEMGFAYDTSRLQTSGEIVVWAEFQTMAGVVDELRSVARASLAHRKRTQPLDVPSAGCVFQNPDMSRDRVPDGIPPSAGALVDRAGLKGHRIGGAMISPTHANFIVNDQHATASDIFQLIETARRAVHERFGVQLRDEVVRIGEF